MLIRSASQANSVSRQQDVFSAQIGLLFANSNVSLSVTLIVATILGLLQWGIVPRYVAVDWWLYVALIAAARYYLSRRYRRNSGSRTITKWRTLFVIGAALAGIGWGGAGIL